MVNFEKVTGKNNQLMNSQQFELYQRIQAFSLDEPDSKLTLSKRLARDNGWSLKYTWKVIEEYKKFTFLAVVAGHPVAPSDQVDQVWHLHLSYTRSYWQEFCPKILCFPLHHEPTRGGSSEQLKIGEWYSRTLESYERFFGEVPQTDIWPEPKDRFGRDLHFVRVNQKQNWVVPKLSLSSLKVQLNQAIIFSLVFTLAFVVTGCQVIARFPNPLNFTGPVFLNFYILMSVVFIAIAYRLRAFLRLPDGTMQQPIPLDAYETAYLADGKVRVVDTAIVSLVHKGYVTVQHKARMLVLEKPVEESFHPVERAIADSIFSDGHIDKVRSTAIVAVNSIRDRLRQLDLLVKPIQSFKAQTAPAVLIAALLGLGIDKIFVGISRGKPIGYLCVLCILIAIVGLLFWLIPTHRSRYGDRILQDLRTRMQGSIKVDNPDDPQLPILFALLGMTVLSSDIFADLKQVFTRVASSSSDGGGGCGGGGCGGCSG